MRDRWRRDPGLVLVILALVAAAALYAPTLTRGLVNLDDPWLIEHNWLLQEASTASLRAVFFGFDRETRFILGAEYLPIRDVSVMFDRALWGSWYGGHHLTNLILYLASIGLWFGVLATFGVERWLVGVAILLWAVHPSHAESVAWLSERKGLLGMAFAGVAGLGFARYRAGRRGGWLALAMLAAGCAIWSKAPSAFAIAALVGLELSLPARRVSWRRSLAGLGAIAVVGLAAFVPVLKVAADAAVVASADHAPAGWATMAVGLHGFYLQLGAMLVPNAVSYPISLAGPTTLDLVAGALGLLAVGFALCSFRGRWCTPPEVRAAAFIWLCGWFPVSRLVLPLRAVLVADRYLLFASLGLALALAFVIARIPSTRARYAILIALVAASSLRALDAQANWRDGVSLWERAVRSNPADGDAWSMYADAVIDAGRPELAFDVLRQGARHSRSPRLLLRKALFVLRYGQRAAALEIMRQAAEAGDERAMTNLALLHLEDGRLAEAVTWSRRATEVAPLYVNGQRNRGKVALAARQPAEALDAFTRAYRLEPRKLDNRFNLALALIELGRLAEARPHLEACLDNPALRELAQQQLVLTARP